MVGQGFRSDATFDFDVGACHHISGLTRIRGIRVIQFAAGDQPKHQGADQPDAGDEDRVVFYQPSPWQLNPKLALQQQPANGCLDHEINPGQSTLFFNTFHLDALAGGR